MSLKKKLIVTALSATPFSGSEPGKAFNWTLALSKYFEVHVILLKHKINACEESGLCKDWIFHPIDLDGPRKGGISFYIWYAKWCDAVIDKCRDLINQENYAGLHHPVLGSFRMFPRYDKLGIRYTLGPLGGGETAPCNLLKGSGFPLINLAEEYARPFANDVSLMIPNVRKVIANASKILATTRESEEVLKKANASNTAIVFPDVIEESQSRDNEILEYRDRQKSELPNCFKLMFSGRSLWWKGGSFAIRFLDRLIRTGLNASLDVYGNGSALVAWEKLSEQLEIPRGKITFHGMVERKKLLEAYASSHLFVYPTLHDSSSSAILEAYSTGLPSMTIFCGGARTASLFGAGVNFTPQSWDDFFDHGVDEVGKWINNPQKWITCCELALGASKRFSRDFLESAVTRELEPIFRN